MPALLASRPVGLQIVLSDLVPLAFGAVCGIVLGTSKPIYTVLTLLALLGGFLAGLEHRGAGEGAARGEVGGLLFGVGILLAHGLAKTKAKSTLPDPEILLVVITALIGAGLGALGGALRGRRERRAQL